VGWFWSIQISRLISFGKLIIPIWIDYESGYWDLDIVNLKILKIAHLKKVIKGILTIWDKYIEK
jgi:hypothetical protein